jgi:putative ABC transport system permease protein
MHEIGIRLALGAERRSILRMVLGQGVALVLIGASIGLAAAVGVSRSMAGVLYGIRPIDPATFVIVSALLVGVAVSACYLAARRAVRVNPMIALRSL